MDISGAANERHHSAACGISVSLHGLVQILQNWTPGKSASSFDYRSFVELSEVWEDYASCFVLFLKITLEILHLLWLHINFRTICTSSVKNCMGNLIGITINLWIILSSIAILTILILPIQEHGIYLSISLNHL